MADQRHYCEHNVEHGVVQPNRRDMTLHTLDRLCEQCVVRFCNEADARGDGALVNALCWYGRARFGPNLVW